MAITGTFIGDFSSFNKAVKEAEGHLKGFEQESANVETQLNKMAGSGATQGLQNFTTAAGTTTTAMGTLSGGLSQVDRTLAQFGVNLTPQIAAIREMEGVAGKTAAQLGAFGTAASVAAAALAGWGLGRMVAEFFDLDRAIGDATASLLGYGNAAAEVAGHKQDILNRAFRETGVVFTDYGAALKAIQEKHADFEASINTSTHRVEQWRTEIAKVKSEGRLAELQADLTSQNSTLKELSSTYGISERALGLLSREMATAEGEARKATAAFEAQARAIENMIAKQQAFIPLAPAQPKDVEIDFKPTGAYKQILDEATALREQEEALALVNEQMNTHFLVVGQTADAHTKAAASAQEHGDAVDQVTEGYRQMGSAAGGAFQIAVPQGFSYTQAYRDAGRFVHDSPFLGRSVAEDPALFGQPALGALPRHMLRPPRGQGIYGFGSGQGGGGGNVTVNMQGMMMTDNPASQANVERLVKEAVFEGIKNSRKF